MIVVFKNPTISLLISAMPDIDIKVIAEKDVPSGILFKIIEENIIPIDIPQELWEIEINESNADGVGLTKEEFESKYPEFKGWAVQ